MAVPETIQMAWKTMVETNRFDKILQKVKLITAGQGLCTAEMTVSEEHCNMDGSLHGGFTSTLVDVISGVALCTHKYYPPRGVSVDLHITIYCRHTFPSETPDDRAMLRTYRNTTIPPETFSPISIPLNIGLK